MRDAGRSAIATGSQAAAQAPGHQWVVARERNDQLALDCTSALARARVRRRCCAQPTHTSACTALAIHRRAGTLRAPTCARMLANMATSSDTCSSLRPLPWATRRLQGRAQGARRAAASGSLPAQNSTLLPPRTRSLVHPRAPETPPSLQRRPGHARPEPLSNPAAGRFPGTPTQMLGVPRQVPGSCSRPRRDAKE